MTRRADLRNIASIERLSKELLVQCGHYRRNSEKGDDSIRFMLFRLMAQKILRVTEQGERRYFREHQP
jgi:hypothetical protein